MPLEHSPLRVNVRRALPIVSLLLALACGGSEGGKGPRREHGDKVDSADGLVVDVQVRRGPPYQPGTVSDGGTIRGSVTLPAVAPSAGTCPVPAKTPRAIAWLSDIGRGREPDELRRVEVSTGKCTVDPLVQVAIAGSTINVRNDDPYVQRFDFIRGTSDRPVSRMQFVADGQLVPNEKVLASPGVVEIRSDRDGLRGWVFVVDHPYVAPVGDDGKFELTDVPAGRYTLSLWTPAGIVDQQVAVTRGAVAEVSLTAK